MLPFRSGRARRVLLLILIGLNFANLPAWAQQQNKKSRKKPGGESATSATPEPNSQIPLPIGREAKGLVLPDIDENGHLRSRFIAGTARRVDRDHMEFRDLKITTFTDDNQIDLEVTMAQSVLDMNTRVLSSPQPTTIKRSDFNIVGDTARFDTAARQGTITGHVKMVVTDATKFTAPKPQ